MRLRAFASVAALFIFNKFKEETMNWILLTLSSIVFWGITDILLKKSLHRNDPLSHLKTFIWIGLVMAPAGCIAALCSDTLLDSIGMLSDELYLIPLCA